MKSEDMPTFGELAAEYLGRPLPERLAGGLSLADQSESVREITVRMLALMKRGGFPATDLNSMMIWFMGTVNPAMLPPAWGGRIPPLTARGRHRKLDDYVASQARPSGKGAGVYVDLGCGFPPATTVDTAGRLPDWSVFGVDRSFASFILYDADGNYACFDRAGDFLYLQPARKPLHDNPKAFREYFESLFAELFPAMGSLSAGASTVVEKNGHRLIHNHVRDYEAPNLKFLESELEAVDLPAARVVRCMNVLLYFNREVRRRMQGAMGAMLEEDGLLLSGFSHPFGGYARYVVRKKEGRSLRPVEFAFSPDNLRPLGIGPWVTIEDGDEDAEMLADLTFALRADPDFWPAFNARVDALQEKNDLCRRDGDGFIRFTEAARSASPLEIMKKTAALWQQMDAEGYTDGAVAALNRAGFTSWKNPVGDIAVRPSDVG